MKNNKKFIKYFIILSIIGIGVLPMQNFYLYAIQYDFKKLFNTDTIERYVNYSFYKLLNRSLIQEKVIVGKDGFLFLGNNYDHVIHKAQGLYPYNNKKINNWANKLKDIQTWYEDKGIKFVIVIAPNKHTIYNDKLPDWIQAKTKTITDEILNFSHTKGIHILDLRNLLQAQKSTQLYLATDSHWNRKGASIAYEETIKYINHTYGINYKIPKYDLSLEQRRSGDLAKLLKIKSILPNDYEEEYTPTFDEQSTVCHGFIDKSHHLETCINKQNPEMIISRQDQYMINEHSPNQEKLLLLCDSFATANSKLYNATFSTIWKFRHNRIYGQRLAKFVDSHKPDVVIYQIIERELYDEGIVVKLSQDIKLHNPQYLNRHTNKIFDIYDLDTMSHTHQGFSLKDNELIVANNDPILIINELKSHSNYVRLDYSLDSLVNTHFQLFYREKKQDPYSKYHSYSLPIKNGINTISLSVPTNYIRNGLRVDLVSKRGKYQLKKFSIYEMK